MSKYRSIWRYWWFAVLAVCGAAAALSCGPLVVLATFALGTTVAACVGLGITHDPEHQPPSLKSRLHNVSSPSLWAGSTLVALVRVSSWHPGMGLSLTFAVAGTCPWVVAKLTPIATAKLGTTQRSKVSPRQVRRMNLTQLNNAWLDTERTLIRARSTNQLLDVARQRQVLLDEMERREWFTIDDFDAL